MAVNTEMRDDLENRYNESKSRWEEAMQDKEQAKSSYEGAQNSQNFYEKEAAGEWGQDIPPGNTSDYRKSLESERDKKFEEYQNASDKEEKAKCQYVQDKENWDTYRSIEDQAYSNDEDNDKGY